jgi:hypothetical protein
MVVYYANASLLSVKKPFFRKKIKKVIPSIFPVVIYAIGLTVYFAKTRMVTLVEMA